MKVLKLSILMLLYLIILQTKAQNLITNGDFETIIGCPGSIYGHGISIAQPWQSALPNSPVYFNICSSKPKFDVPLNLDSLLGYQWPHSGNGYSGFNLYSPNGFIRWYAQIQLTDSLISGKSYCLTLYANLANNCQYGIDAIGAHFSVTPDTCFGLNCLINVSPQVSNPSGNIITDTLGWSKIEGCFTATGGEKYLTIGNFKSDSATQKAINRPSYPWSSFYYLDDVSLYEDTTLSINQHPINNELLITPNPANEFIEISNFSSDAPINYSIYNATGNAIEFLQTLKASYKIEVSELPTGIYFLKIQLLSGNILVRKFVVSRR
ncbi:MAG: T9SS type A sorting domain-containing protein [Bacteroidetes bacterium]|nr:T9SS type A sorting domain-containing protein [Bacteroidota bacterium]MBK9672683.1 T9SS type A sorting domain-containing protein [Bacteroidota bacterium]MBK9800297.1 T9SS type A sorting domain-containing protein [Bacteroidota bacterium]MBP6412455.1 T9SS type A sorting domain-containing protein [Bacteroidia bacterium]